MIGDGHVLEMAGRAANAVRELNHRTRDPRAFDGPAELYRLVGELAVLAGGCRSCWESSNGGCGQNTTPAGSARAPAQRPVQSSRPCAAGGG